MLHANGFNSIEIAEIIGAKVTTVCSNLRHARDGWKGPLQPPAQGTGGTGDSNSSNPEPRSAVGSLDELSRSQSNASARVRLAEIEGRSRALATSDVIAEAVAGLLAERGKTAATWKARTDLVNPIIRS